MSQSDHPPSRRRTGISRRDFLLQTGAILLGLGTVPLLQSCGGQASEPTLTALPDTQAPTDIKFSHSVASGDPLSDRVILWTRITTTSAAAVAVDFIVATDS